jgi:nitrate reductase NapE component
MMSFSDKLLFLVMSIALIVTMGFIVMIFQDLNDLWSEILKFQER